MFCFSSPCLPYPSNLVVLEHSTFTLYSTQYTITSIFLRTLVHLLVNVHHLDNLTRNAIHEVISTTYQKDGITVDISMEWKDGYH